MISTHLRLTLAATSLTLLAGGLTAAPTYSATQMLPSPSAPTYNSPTVSESSYTLGAGDRLQIDVFDAPEFSGENGRRQVLVDGTLNVPLIGTLSVKGMTLKQAEAELSKRYARFFKRAGITVTLLTPRPLSVGILGEVGRPGTYTIPLAAQDGGTQFPTLTRALQTAGGITQAADVRQVQIRRPQRVGAPQVITVDLWNYFQSGNLQADLTLRDGDSIFIAANPNPNLAESLQLADTTFAAEKGKPVNIAIVGEVFRPGSYVVAGANSKNAVAGALGSTAAVANNLDKPPTITQAIQIAGGIKPLADIRNVQIRRLTRAGGEQLIAVDLMKLLQTGDVQQDAILQTGDTISIPTATAISAAEASKIASASFSPDIIRVNVVGEVRQPGVVQVPPNTPLNQALLAAGGFDVRRARKKSVELIRLNPDGTVTRRDVAIDFAKGINDQTNPAMRNNDVIIVGRSGLTSFTDTVGNILNPLFPLASFLNIFGLP
ncbi:polysaccharide biosynthesis/export family protein [Stenomitos frigidus]|uniref:polysaccharide biosynthesis/export family protein n=1 Tax=Stenomitos frigidus TaxID=1886765 RepID=UPI001C639524|nr:polysaccharide biosynthesis/export family protein [Stenomitos frigidus]